MKAQSTHLNGSSHPLRDLVPSITVKSHDDGEDGKNMDVVTHDGTWVIKSLINYIWPRIDRNMDDSSHEISLSQSAESTFQQYRSLLCDLLKNSSTVSMGNPAMRGLANPTSENTRQSK